MLNTIARVFDRTTVKRLHLALLLGTLATPACSSASSGDSSVGSDDNAGGASGGVDPSGADALGGSGGSLNVDTSSAASSGGGNQIAEVYGNSPDTLYKLDPNTKAVNVVGHFDGCNQVTDIALDKDSNLYGTTFSALFKIDRNTAKCTFIAAGVYPNSLSFVPKGTVDPNVEALVGYNRAQYVRIDPQSGHMTTIGGLTGGYASSGDIVSVIGGGTFLTVTGPQCGDCIIEVDPVTGDLKENWGPVGHSNVFGLAFWAGSAYGFSSGGQLFEIDFSGPTVRTTPIPIPGAPAGLLFWGAGSTTSAPAVAVH